MSESEYTFISDDDTDSLEEEENTISFDDLKGIVPDKLEDGTYLCVIQEVKINKSKKHGTTWFVINWQVLKPEKFQGFESIPDMTRLAGKDEFNAADPEDKQKIVSDYRKRNERLYALGFSRKQISTLHNNLDVLVGIKALLSIQVRPRKDGKSGYNIFINEVTLSDEDEIFKSTQL